MKKVNGLIGMLLLTACVLALPSPEKSTGHDQTLGADLGKEMATNIVATPSMEYKSYDRTFQVAETDIMRDNIVSPNTEIFIPRHFFDPEDLKTYPEYIAGELSDGYPLPVDRPAR